MGGEFLSTGHQFSHSSNLKERPGSTKLQCVGNDVTHGSNTFSQKDLFIRKQTVDINVNVHVEIA